MTTLPEAKLGIQVTLGMPPRPTGVVVMVGKHLLAVVSLKELRRVAAQVDDLEVAAEHHGHDQEVSG